MAIPDFDSHPVASFVAAPMSRATTITVSGTLIDDGLNVVAFAFYERDIGESSVTVTDDGGGSYTKLAALTGEVDCEVFAMSDYAAGHRVFHARFGPGPSGLALMVLSMAPEELDRILNTPTARDSLTNRSLVRALADGGRI